MKDKAPLCYYSFEIVPRFVALVCTKLIQFSSCIRKVGINYHRSQTDLPEYVYHDVPTIHTLFIPHSTKWTKYDITPDRRDEPTHVGINQLPHAMVVRVLSSAKILHVTNSQKDRGLSTQRNSVYTRKGSYIRPASSVSRKSIKDESVGGTDGH